MESAKPTKAVALADELVGKGWRRPRKAARIVAVLCALLAAGIVFALFDRFRVQQGEAKPERQLIGTVDLRIGNPVAAAERGEAKARADIEAGLLQLQFFGPAPGSDATARAQRLKQRYGITQIHKGRTATEVAQAFADAYNRVMRTEIERRHGRELADQLLPAHDAK